MKTILKTREVGPWPMNSYLVVCAETGSSALVDPGADADKIIEMAQGTHVAKILITHGHEDHIGALDEVKNMLGAPVYINPQDAIKFNLAYDAPLVDGMQLTIGKASILAIHTPGHTPGMTCFYIGENRTLVGDTIFVGGPGKTWSPMEFMTTMKTMQDIVFKWPDNTIFYPGHGPSGRIGEEHPAFESFVARGWSSNLYGDVTWK